MQLHQLRPNYKRKKSKRIGRGGKRGSTSGRGSKGQKARAGRRLKPIIGELIKKYPKLRGYKFKSQVATAKFQTAIVNLDILEKKFSNGEKITPDILLEKAIVGKIKGKSPKVKILGKGEITKSFIIEGCLISKQAKEKVEKAGGKIILWTK